MDKKNEEAEEAYNRANLLGVFEGPLSEEARAPDEALPVSEASEVEPEE